FDEDPPHGLGGGGEEVPAAVPVWGLLDIDQADVGFVDQGGGLQRLAWPFVRHLFGRQLAQLVVDQRQELLRGVRVAFLQRRQDAGDIAHTVKDNRRGDHLPYARKGVCKKRCPEPST